jgi:hypothetical protein
MTPAQVDEMIAGLKNRRTSTFKVSHNLKLKEGGIWCLDINQVFSSEDEIPAALLAYCRLKGRGALMTDPAPAEGWKRFIAAPRPIPPPRPVRIWGTPTGWVLIIVRKESV